jgi:hypothetical protein
LCTAKNFLPEAPKVCFAEKEGKISMFMPVQNIRVKTSGTQGSGAPLYANFAGEWARTG